MCGRLAGYPQYSLMENGAEVAVDKHNVGEYIKAVVAATLHAGVHTQIRAFRQDTPRSLAQESPCPLLLPLAPGSQLCLQAQ